MSVPKELKVSFHKDPAEFDVIIIGGGIIGLALAAKLSTTKRLLLIEQHSDFGSETSSRNSEVIHAGLYYRSNSLKENLSILGRHKLYEYAQQRHINHQKIGKLIVSQQADCSKLAELAGKAQSLDIPVKRLNNFDIQKLEPQLEGQSALLSTQTGVIDSHALMQALAYDAEQAGGLLVRHSRFKFAEQSSQGFDVLIDTHDGVFETRCDCLINAAGLYATQVAKQIQYSHPNREIRNTLFCAGHYFSYQGKAPFKRLIYPLPDPNLVGLGIHATLDLSGQVRFGPDAQYVSASSPDNLTYQFDAQHKAQFIRAISAYFPDIKAEQLQPDYMGIRPKLSAQYEPSQDFSVQIQSKSNACLVELFGIESPGLTACLALADYVQERL